jgi:hypothetical protein
VYKKQYSGVFSRKFQTVSACHAIDFEDLQLNTNIYNKVETFTIACIYTKELICGKRDWGLACSLFF